MLANPFAKLFFPRSSRPKIGHLLCTQSYNEKSTPTKETPKNNPRFPPIALTKVEKSTSLLVVYVETAVVV